MTTTIQRRLPGGAEIIHDESAHFRVWAPARKQVAVVLGDGRTAALEREEDGYFSGIVKNVHAGDLYRYTLDGESRLLPDPMSRFQPDGPHGPSQVIDPTAFPWTDSQWPGIELPGQVLYELHVGTFTPEGTWHAARQHLYRLVDIGITTIEVMPVSDFVGSFGWGYDGVNLFAPTRLYGTPDDFRAFVDDCHQHGLGIILDVVYNHFGPDGNYVGEFSPKYFTKRYANEWGEALNFDCNEALPVREYFVSNARYWVEEFHIDGLRLDATQQIFDSSREHIVAEITRRTCEASPDKPILIVAENEPQHSRMLRSPRAGGYGLDALWNDDFHHTARVAATGRNEAYYSGYFGTPQEFLSAIKWGFLYQGQYYGWQKKTRGTPALDIEASRFIVFLENHDQVANSAYGARFHQLCGSGLYRALTAVFLLSPQTPMLFQGQEFGSSKPFRYFADHQGALADLVQDGRRAFLRQFPSLKRGDLCPPLLNDKTAFTECKLDHTEADKNRWIVQLHKDLLQLRREDSVFSQQRSDMLQGAVLGEHAFLLRYFAEENDDRLILVNLGRDLVSDTFPEPLLAAPEGRHWRVLWTSESSIYGGCAAPPLDEDERWSLPGNCTVVLRATPRIVEVAKP